MTNNKTAMIDVGGGFRSIYGAGVTDQLIDRGITFDKCYGVSAGSANIVSYLAGQRGRTKKFYTDYAFRPEYASANNFIKFHNYANLDYIYSTLSNSDGEYPLDYKTFAASPTEFTVVACDARNGHARYFDKSDVHQDNYNIMKASSAVPVACEPYVIDGVPYYDGGIADPIPVQLAVNEGFDRIVLVLTHQRDFVRKAKRDAAPAAILKHSYPAAAERLKNRYRTYNEEMEVAEKLAAEGKLLILAPKDLYGLDTLSKNSEGLEKMYQDGFEAAKAVPEFLAG
ncbi:putative patatin/cPLA2 family phospholipase [Bifidobacterium commune]|uniref:Predicted phospholipase, patatin/cPLA2 family n=1 Tax=Bifidobacterium commune TaxID=1505727 RepID=A0A1C4GZJ9_9BIFI|nr:patatin family protein [Bifidobacterium commune]MBB2955242.1 putative patatin/cPLA2 family phospholipase [Bifidobacterium commune]SCC78095.1 Predicted phospholipase, patatin/cPLA2 family [Bifidobacterium commune]